MANEKNTAKTEQNIPIFVPGYALESRRNYSNYVAVRTTGMDFTLTFMDVCPPTEEEVKKVEKGEPIPVPVNCEVVVPNDIIPALIKALQNQYSKFNEKQPSESK